MTKRLALALLLSASAAMAADRHVYLNSTGGGSQLNDCPNPNHNTKGVADNTDELTYCTTSSPHKFICNAASGCKSWTTTTAICGAGNVANVTNGVTVDVDGDGTAETVYGHPQACVWNMAKSDTCEVHAGDYTTAGAQANASVVLNGSPAVNNVCNRSDCWRASFVAFGYGPNMGTTGYGTVASPAYVRGAEMNGSTDTWDSDLDKIPDTVAGEPVSYPAILNGNVDGDANLNESTSCDATSCSGDAFYAAFVGCGNENEGSGPCADSGSLDTAHGQTRPLIDSDADGTFDTNANSGGPRNVSFFRIKNLEFKNYGGGATTCDGNGIREALGAFAMGGGGETIANGDDLTVDHIYWHNGAYSTLCQTEHYVAIFGDDENWACSNNNGARGYTEIMNSYLESNNRFVINDDCDATNTPDGASECGCSKSLHDNRIIITNNSSADVARKGLIRWKSVDTVEAGDRRKQFWIYNNEIIWQKSDAANSTYLFHVECFGKCDPQHQGLGTISFHGNILRMNGSSSPKFKRISQLTCGDTISTGVGGIDWTYYDYNNTYDLEQIGGGGGTQPYERICNTSGKLHVNKNNAIFGLTASTLNLETVTTSKIGDNYCSSANTGCTTAASNVRTTWWTTGTQNIGINAGMTNYVPLTSGPLDGSTTLDSAGHGPCDPDSDGTAGTDYDGDGDQDTTWTDIAGNSVSCPTDTSPLDIGAVQNSSTGGSAFCGNNLREGSEVCDGSDLNSQTCVTQGFASGTLTCNAGCTAFVTSACVAGTGGATGPIKRGVIKRGVKIR